jgi:hypothetical protein|tara:strand:- start:1247 stop:2086 length:840 start_codon:yes stop_codon:yes gene_type:complete
MAIQTTQNLPAPYIESELKAFLPQAGKAGATDTTSALGLPSLAAESAFTGQGRKAGAAQAGLTYDPTSNVLGAGTGVAAYEPYLTKAAQYADPANISAFETPQQNYAIQAMQDEQARQQGQLSNAALQSGAFGGGRHGVAQGQLSAQGAQDIGLFKNDMYNQAMQNMFQASGMQQGLGEQTQQQGIANAALLNQLGAGQLGYSQAGLDTSAQAAEMKRQEPFNRLGWYGGQLSQLMGGMPNPYMQTSPEQSSASPFMQALASGAGAYGLGGMLGKMWGA